MGKHSNFLVLDEFVLNLDHVRSIHMKPKERQIIVRWIGMTDQQAYVKLVDKDYDLFMAWLDGVKMGE